MSATLPDEVPDKRECQRLTEEIEELRQEIVALEHHHNALERDLPRILAKVADRQADCLLADSDDPIVVGSANESFRQAQIERRTTEVSIKQAEATLDVLSREVLRRESLLRELSSGAGLV